jgi:prepilin-type processing-associated H-X9-DG protein
MARADVAYSHYAGLHHDVEAPIDADNHGLFFLNSRVTQHDVTDGLGYTLMIGEKRIDHPLPDLGWLSGTAATLRNTGTPINMTGKKPPGAVTPFVLPDDASDVDAPLSGNTRDSVDNAGEGGQVAGAGNSAATDTPPTGEPTQPSPTRQEALHVGGFGSDHPTGANFGFADGQVRFLTQDIDASILQQLGHRADGQLLDMNDVE